MCINVFESVTHLLNRFKTNIHSEITDLNEKVHQDYFK